MDLSVLYPLFSSRNSRTRITPNRPLRLMVNSLEDRLAPATLTVNTLTDSTGAAQLSLRDALVAINNGSYSGGAAAQISGTFGDNDTILFQTGLNGTISLIAAKGPLPIAKNVTLTANPAVNAITISGGNQTGVFQVTGTTTASIAGLTITQGKDSVNLFGAINVQAGSSLTLSNSTLTGNQSMGTGGGAILNAGTLTVVNSTFNLNSGVNGGAINNLSGATATLINSTISNNQATTGSGLGGGVANAGTLKLLNTIIAQNKSAGTAIDVSGTVQSAGHNLIGNTTGATGLTDGSNGDQVGMAAPFTGNLTSGLNTIENVSSTAGLKVGQLITDSAGALPAGTVIKLLGANTITLSQPAASSQTGITFTSAVNAKLGPLQNNGGGIQTMAPLPMSSAIDAGANTDGVLSVPTADQRGVSRPQAGTVDIGAFEANRLLVTNLNDAGAGSLRDALATSNSTPGTVVIDFQEDLTGTISLTTGRLEVVHDNWIRGPGAAKITIDGNNNFWCFGVNSQYSVGSPGLYVAIDGLTMTRGRQVSGLSDTRGGAISYRNSFPFPSHLTVANSVINNSTNGGIYAEDRLSVINTRIDNNTGHGININGDFLDVSDSWLSGNTSNGINADVHAVLVNTTLSGNTANGIRNGNGNQLLTNSTVTGNGKGVEVSFEDIGRYINTTIVGNTTEDARTVVGNGVGNMIFANSIVGKMVVQFGIFTSQGNNVFMNGFPNTLLASDVVPPVVTSIAGSSGGTLASGKYFYTVTAVTSAGPMPSLESSVTVGANNKVTLNWNAPINAATVTNYQIYRGTSSGNLQLIATLASGANTYVDTGTAGTSTGGTFLANLADNGGATPTMALTTSGRSYAGGKANATLSPLFDQRGMLRNPSFPDVGAYQSPSSTPNVLSITPATLPGLRMGMNYSQTLTASGGTGTGYLFGLLDGELPPGFSLGLDGRLMGTVTTLGTYTFTVTCFDSAGNRGQQEYTLQVNPPPTIITGSLPNAAVGTNYSTAIQISGGSAPFTWSINGQLPNGVTFDTNTGTFNGIPEAGTAGVYSNIEVMVTDFFGDSATKTYSLSVQWAIGLNPSLPAVTLDTTYNHSQTITGGSGTYSSLNVTGLPDGLSASIIGSTLSIFGTPTEEGTFPLTITLHDDVTNTTSLATNASITVNPALEIITHSLPNWTETLAFNQTIQTTGGTGALEFELVTGDLPDGLTLNGTTGMIDGTPTTGSEGNYSFTVQVTDESGAVVSQAYSLTISAVRLGTLTFSQWSANKAGFIGTIPVSTGTGSHSLQLTSGALPVGMTHTLNNGVISFAGTPTIAGLATFTFELTDGLGVKATQTYTIEITPASTLVWTGLGADANFLTAGNWAGGVAPVAGNTLLFGGGSAVGQKTANNNFPAGTSFALLRFTDSGYTITGNDVKLTSGIHSTGIVGDTNTVALNITLLKTSAFNIAGNSTVITSGVLSGRKLGLTKTGTGTLALNSTTGNTYTGLTTVNGGTLQLNGNNQIIDTGTVVVNPMSVLDLNDHQDTIANLTIVGGTVETGTGTLSVSGAVRSNAATTAARINGQLHLTNARPTLTVMDGLAVNDMVLGATITAASITKVGTGTLEFNGNNSTYTGTTKVSGGVLALPNPAALGSGPLMLLGRSVAQLIGDGLAFNNPLTFGGRGATLRNPSGENRWAGPITNTITGTVDIGAGELTLAGSLDGVGGLIKNGQGTLILPNANTYRGATTINAGVLEVPNPAAIGSTSAITVGTTATFFMDGTGLNFNRTLNLRGTLSSTNGSNTWSGRINTVATTGFVNIGTGETLTLSGSITGRGGLTVNDGHDGTLVLSGANSYAGATTIKAGITSIRNAKALGSASGATTVANGATLQMTGDLKLAEKLTLNGNGAAGSTGALQHVSGTSTWTSTIVLASPSTVAIDAGELTLGGRISGTGGLNKVGAGRLTMAAFNTALGGTTVNAGTLGGGGSAGALLINSGATLAPGSTITQILRSGNVTFATGSTFAVEVNGLRAGKNHDQLNVTGSVDLADATLDVTLGFTPAVGNTFTLIQNDGTDAIVGTFAGLAEGATLALSGLTYRISYVGLTGNDVVLTRTA